jgi:hypothetical protein
MEHADGRVLMHGKKMFEEAGKLCTEAAGVKPWKAMAKRDIQRPKSEPERA